MKVKNVILKYLLLLIVLVTSCSNNGNHTANISDSNVVYDAIIVPGVPYNDKEWKTILMERIYWSYYLYKTGKTKNIIYSGSAVYTPYVEAKIMAMYGAAFGINTNNIYIETKAQHSVENMYYSYQLAKKLGFHKIALATDPFQSKMMEAPSKKMKLNIDFIPFPLEIMDTLHIKEYHIDAEKAHVDNFTSLDDRENFFQR